jgi:glycosyltransferase involved in cell wall biosynthesis
LDESEKFKILNICDLFVSTSQHEGFGLAFLEAMQSGLPIVCYDNGGQNDFLKDQETGYLVKLNDINQFTNRCEILINNPKLRERIGGTNRVRAEEFHIDRCAALYEDVFTATLSTFGDKKSNYVNANEMRRHLRDTNHE